MKSHTVIILWIIAILLGVSVYSLKKSDQGAQNNATDRAPGQKFIPDFPTEQIAEIQITDSQKTTTLIGKDGQWTVVERDNYPAQTRNINDLLRTLSDLKVTQSIEAGPSFAPRFGMDEKSTEPAQHGVTASFKDSSGKVLTTLTFGKNLDSAASSSGLGGGSTGRFIRNHADASGFYAVSELFSTLTADPKSWLTDEFFGIDKIEKISLTKAGSDENEWTLLRDDETAEFKFAEAFPGVKIDPAAVAPLKSLFSYTRFDDVVPASEIATQASPEKLQKVDISTFEGLNYKITLQPAKAADENFLLTVKASGEIPEQRKKAENEKPEDTKVADEAFQARRETLTGNLAQIKKLESRTFLVSKFTVAALLKSRADFMDKGPGPSSQAQPTQPANGADPVYSPVIRLPEQ